MCCESLRGRDGHDGRDGLPGEHLDKIWMKKT